MYCSWIFWLEIFCPWTFSMWDVLSWDPFYLGHFVCGHFLSGTFFWDIFLGNFLPGTFCLETFCPSTKIWVLWDFKKNKCTKQYIMMYFSLPNVCTQISIWMIRNSKHYEMNIRKINEQNVNIETMWLAFKIKNSVLKANPSILYWFQNNKSCLTQTIWIMYLCLLINNCILVGINDQILFFTDYSVFSHSDIYSSILSLSLWRSLLLTFLNIYLHSILLCYFI